jgi:hypothetical protein
VQICTGREHACAITDGGRVLCWGDGGSGQLGNGVVVDYRLGPTYVKGLGDAVQIACGDHGVHSCALRATGEVVCWGGNDAGQLGDRSTTDRSAPVSVTGITDAVQVVAGEEFTCALTLSGGVRCWGSDANGQLGNGGAREPRARRRRRRPDRNGRALQRGFSCCRTAARLRGPRRLALGKARVLGERRERLASETRPPRRAPRRSTFTASETHRRAAQPTRRGASMVGSVAAGDDATVAIRRGGLASAWGSNTSESLATGATTQFPLRMLGLGPPAPSTTRSTYRSEPSTGARFEDRVSPFAGARTTTAEPGQRRPEREPLRADARRRRVELRRSTPATLSAAGCSRTKRRLLGRNTQGQIGDEPAHQRAVPTDVRGGRGFVEVDAGIGHSCGVTVPGASTAGATI